ncbi:Para-Rep C7 [Seminavis robusta]|uniref:Para-Rep C7 n=1 Tax=Seminavis robusta TaxID=568900 RepID=A0A9N8HWH3_9STRA|nr:Para-Rep C7 [Seminavis robusta]|eukprot:Sro2176_g317850.1 Para-Rep C7 (243) ;mRNA; f:12914-13642
MPGTGPRAKYWSFTLNNYTPADIDRLSSATSTAEIDYLIFGREVGASGTPHLQGTVCFQSRKRLQQVTTLIGRAHCSVTRHLSQSIEYCKKDGDFSELGNIPTETSSGRKKGNSDLEEFKQSVKEGVTDPVELRELHSDICARVPRFVREYVDDHRPKPTTECHPLRNWQASLNESLRRTANTREIIFVVDKTGNQGKSWFARYYCELHDNAQIVVPGRKADMAYVINEESKVFFFDCPRSK